MDFLLIAMLTVHLAVIRPLPALRGRLATILYVAPQHPIRPVAMTTCHFAWRGAVENFSPLTYLCCLVPMAGDDHGSCELPFL